MDDRSTATTVGEAHPHRGGHPGTRLRTAEAVDQPGSSHLGALSASEPAPPPSPDDLAHASDVCARIVSAVGGVIEGKDPVIRTAVVVVLAGGHLLLEDVPGVGKTMLAKAMARAVGGSLRRIQFTPDLLPSDITGVTIFNQDEREFEFRPGAVFAHVVVCDEINRASPKTQSAVLEAMEEAQVTVDGQTYLLPRPFLVIATQNPLEMEGTYPLPEAQRDRFMARVSIGYPAPTAEMSMLDSHGSHDPLAAMSPVTDAATMQRLVTTVRGIHASPALKRYIVDLLGATRSDRGLRVGASPRAALHLLRAARARAAMAGRDHVLPDDVRALFLPVLEHRVLLSPESQVSRRSAAHILTDVLGRVEVAGQHR